MKKSFLFGSVVLSIVLFSGCGGGGSSDSDTTPPSFTNSTYEFTVDAGTEKSVPLTTDESDATFTEDSAEARIEGSTLIFSAPNFNSSGENSYTVNVFATDKAGNKSAAKVFKFDVKEVITKTYKLDPTYIADTGDKNFKKVGGHLEDPSGLLWDDVVSDKMDYNSAKRYCEAKGTGWRIPTRAEFLNIIDYSKSSASLIDNDFTKYSADSVEVSWVENLTGEKYVVNHTGGADTTLSNDANHTVLCVYGDKNTTAHTFQTVADGIKDNITRLTWKKIDTSLPSSYSIAENGCPNGWTLPTINQLRSIIEYNTNTITSNIATALPNGSNPNTYFIWSSTVAKDGTPGQHYTIYLDGNRTKAGVISDENNMTHYYTCVKDN
jgi:hypothetical protein